MKGKCTFPEGYEPIITPLETERAIQVLRQYFQTGLSAALDLRRVTAPLLVRSGAGINDDLNGTEVPVSFDIDGAGGMRVEVVQSLAKWKRLVLAGLGLRPGQGIYAEMNALRPSETLDNLHSVYVDQWDWELAIGPDDRTIEYLERTVRKIYRVIHDTEIFMHHQYGELVPVLPDEISFFQAGELADRYPGLGPREREDVICRAYGAVFITGIGAELSDGRPHDGRAPDYDDWTTPNGRGLGLNGDILVWHPVLGRAMELSSMGIRVDARVLERQLRMCSAENRRDLYFHRRLLAGELPLSMGGGIGQSRLSMFLLKKAHIGEVQAGIWPDDMLESCRIHNIPLFQ